MTNNENRILCLIASYNGSKTISDCLNSICKQKRLPDKIWIIDNASHDGTTNLIANLKIPNVEILVQDKNYGLGQVYNKGLSLAIKFEFNWLWILDQDSSCDKYCLDALETVTKNSTPNTVVFFPNAVSNLNPGIKYPPYVWSGKNFENVGNERLNSGEVVSVDSSISSGALYRVDALQKAGGFREEFFIDFVDHEMHLRLKKSGYNLAWIPEAVLYHEIGIPRKANNGETHFVHPAWRYYYMGRNMTIGYWEMGGYKAVLALWKSVVLRRKQLKDSGTYQKKSLSNFLKGVLDAILGRMGKK